MAHADAASRYRVDNNAEVGGMGMGGEAYRDLNKYNVDDDSDGGDSDGGDGDEWNSYMDKVEMRKTGGATPLTASSPSKSRKASGGARRQSNSMNMPPKVVISSSSEEDDDDGPYVGERAKRRAVRTPVGATTRHIRIAR